MFSYKTALASLHFLLVMVCVIFVHAITLGIAQSKIASVYDIFLVINSLLIILILVLVRLSD